MTQSESLFIRIEDRLNLTEIKNDSQKIIPRVTGSLAAIFAYIDVGGLAFIFGLFTALIPALIGLVYYIEKRILEKEEQKRMTSSPHTYPTID